MTLQQNIKPKPLNTDDYDNAEITENDGNETFRVQGVEKIFGETVIRVDNLRKEYSIEGRSDKVIAVNNITFDDSTEIKSIKRGEFLILRGPSGGGLLMN